MLTTEEEQFVAFWEERRKRKQSIFNFSMGLPLGVMIMVALFANILVGWHKGASMAIHNNTSVILVVLVAAIGIVVFISFFSASYQREQSEQRYQELLAKKKNTELETE